MDTSKAKLDPAAKVKVRITIPEGEVFTHAEFAVREDITTQTGKKLEGVHTTDEDGNYKFTDYFKNGDIAEVSQPTADYLEMSGQAEKVGA